MKTALQMLRKKLLQEFSFDDPSGSHSNKNGAQIAAIHVDSTARHVEPWQPVRTQLNHLDKCRVDGFCGPAQRCPFITINPECQNVA
jgi:hypothetical protein